MNENSFLFDLTPMTNNGPRTSINPDLWFVERGDQRIFFRFVPIYHVSIDDEVFMRFVAVKLCLSKCAKQQYQTLVSARPAEGGNGPEVESVQIQDSNRLP